MLIFLDTEFTDFPESECDLISIGLVDENDREFYAESTQYRREACSGFVVDVVLPLLGKHPKRIVDSYWGIAKELNEWLKFYGDEVVTVCFDYHTDWHLMSKLLLLLPEEELYDNIQATNIWGNLDKQAIDWFWLERDTIGWKQHMALYDAHGNRFAYKPLVRKRHNEINGEK
jgi:hypothetical protein